MQPWQSHQTAYNAPGALPPPAVPGWEQPRASPNVQQMLSTMQTWDHNAPSYELESIGPSPVEVTRQTSSGKSDQSSQHFDAEAEWTPSKHEKAIIYTLAVLNLLVALDATIIVTSLSAIIADIGGTTTQAFWIGTSYLLVNAITMPVICSVSEVIGRPICLTFSILAYTIGTIVCCTSQNIGTMLAGRSIQGIGGGGIHSITLVIPTDFIPLRWRPKWYGSTLAAWALGLSLGPVLGGAIAERTTWRWIFYLMFPLCAFGLIVVPLILTLRPKEASIGEKIKRIDWLGAFIFMSSSTALIAISWGGTQYPWGSAATLTPLLVGLVGIGITLWYEAVLAQHPFLRKELFYDASSIFIYIAACLQGFFLYGTTYYCTLYFTAVKGFGPLDAGLAMLPNLLTFAIIGGVTGRLITRFNAYRWAIWAGWFLSSVGVGIYVAWRANDSTPVWVISFIIGGGSHGAILTAQNFASQALCKPRDEGAAAAMYLFARQLGMALGVGIGGATFQNAMKLKLHWEGLPAEIAKHADSYALTLQKLPPGEDKDAIKDAYQFGFQILFSSWLGISFVVLLLSLYFVKHADMNRKLESEHHLDSRGMTRNWGRHQD